MNDRDVSRRELLRWAAGGVASATAFHALGGHALLHAAAQGSDYRALVVVYLAGGNDSFNLVVPTSTAAYADYADARQNLAVPLNDLLPISPSTPDGRTWGLHPAVPELQTLFGQGRLAVIANAGTLVEPVTRTEYQSGAKALPPRLFSHNDQQAQSMQTAADRSDALGWGGAIADRVGAMNGVTNLSPSLTIAGSTPLLVGSTTQAYHMATNGSVAMTGFSGTRGAALQATFDVLRGQAHQNVLERRFAETRGEAIELDGVVRAALDTEGTVATEFPAENQLGDQLRMVARMVAARGALGMERQVFFVRMGGFDTHADQLEDQPVLFARVSQALAAFQAALVEVGAETRVTTAVVSEFGRTLSSNGQGTDHGWGGHYLVLGGSVAGGDIYGTMPSFELGGADDVGAGRMIPTTALDQVAATLAEWLGVPTGDLGTVFPNLGAFSAANLGFMS